MNSNVKLLNWIKRNCFLIAIFSIASNAFAVDVYITKDKDGNPVFSDQPSRGAEKITIEEIQTIPKARTEPISPSSSNVKELPKYDSLTITNPQDDQTIRENTGAISVSLSVSPELRGNDVIKLYMDDKEVSSGKELSFNLSNIDRGTHVFQAAILSPSGKKLIESASVTIHLQRTSIINNPPPAP